MSAVVEFTPLTQEEDTFALAVIEYGGNLAAAYVAAFGKDKSSTPSARARLLISRPEVARRIEELTQLTQEHALISLGSHLQQMAEIRDLAKTAGQLKTAMEAERCRGVVAGFYKESKKDPDEVDRRVYIMTNGGNVQIQAGSTPESPQEWAKRQGTEAVIIENPT